MNWRRGLWRLWLLTSLVWIGFWAWHRDLPCLLGYNYFGLKWLCGENLADLPKGFLWDVPRHTYPLMFGVPILVLAIAYAMHWITTGFRRDSK
jgi:hypothetical protein